MCQIVRTHVPSFIGLFLCFFSCFFLQETPSLFVAYFYRSSFVVGCLSFTCFMVELKRIVHRSLQIYINDDLRSIYICILIQRLGKKTISLILTTERSLAFESDNGWTHFSSSILKEMNLRSESTSEIRILSLSLSYYLRIRWSGQ